MKKILHRLTALCVLLTGFSLLSYKSYSQFLSFGNENIHWEAGLSFGPSFFLGDLGGHSGKGTFFLKDLNIGFTNLMKGGFLTCYPNRWLGIRFAAEMGKLEGNDNVINTKGVDELYRKQRNLDFKSNISQGYIALEVFPTMIFLREDDYEPKLRPYGLLGIGIFHFNPMGSLTDANGNTTWYALQPLRTEGEGMSEYPNRKVYPLTQVNIPMGGGLKYFVSDRVNMCLEILYRKTFTDYIDDVSTTYIDPNLFAKYLSPENAVIARAIQDKFSTIIAPGATRAIPGVQRGNPKQDDAYFSALARIGVRIGSMYENSSQRDAARRTRCPAKL